MGASADHLPRTTVTLSLYLMPEAFTGSGDFEDYATSWIPQRTWMLSGCYFSRQNHCPQYFALRLRGNALHFYTIISPKQQDDYDFLLDAFKQNHITIVVILKAQLRAVKQPPGKVIATFLCHIRTLAQRAYYAHPHLLDQIVLTRVTEGLKNSTLRWEPRKTKLSTADESLTVAFEL